MIHHRRFAFVDLDGVIADSTARFEHAKAITDARYPNGSLADRDYCDLYWQTVFDPQYVPLDVLIEGAADHLMILSALHTIVYLTSRPEAMRFATKQWLDEHNVLHFATNVLMKPEAAKYTKTFTWKASIIQVWASAFGATEVLVFEDEEINLNEIKRYVALPYALHCSKSLKLEEEKPVTYGEWDEDEDHPF